MPGLDTSTSSAVQIESVSNLSKAQRKIWDLDLKRNTIHYPCFAKRVFEGLIPLNNVKTFLKKTDIYNAQRKIWTVLPASIEFELDLFKHGPEAKLSACVETLMSTVLKHFYYTTRRSIVDTHGNLDEFVLEDIEDDPGVELFKECPDITVTGQGRVISPFAIDAEREASYLNCVTPILVKLENERDFLPDLIQMAVWARQCFNQQHNRTHVYSMIATEHIAQLFVFDRVGVCYSDPINIHKNPITFVRMVLGVSSPSDKRVGFDENIFWKEVRYRRSALEGQGDADGFVFQTRFFRFMEVKADDGSSTEYRIKYDRPFLYRKDTIHGKSTYCWEVVDPSTRTSIIVRDSWNVRERCAMEINMLKTASGEDGVVEVLQVVNAQKSVWEARGVDLNKVWKDELDFEKTGLRESQIEKQRKRDRSLLRLFVWDAGRCLYKFESPEEVLLTLKDAIAGHRTYWEKNILHRDVSVFNILIGPAGSRPGKRGTLIDLDIAAWIESGLPETHPQAGTRVFQSYNVLRSLSTSSPTFAHDHLDDLEAFLYCLCYLTHLYARPYVRFPVPSEEIMTWKDEDPAVAADSKMAFLIDWANVAVNRDQGLECKAPPGVSQFFGRVFETLISRLACFFVNRIWDKERRATSEGLTPASTQLGFGIQGLKIAKNEARDDYEEVLMYFDDAIEELKRERQVPASRPAFVQINPEEADSSMLPPRPKVLSRAQIPWGKPLVTISPVPDPHSNAEDEEIFFRPTPTSNPTGPSEEGTSSWLRSPPFLKRVFDDDDDEGGKPIAKKWRPQYLLESPLA